MPIPKREKGEEAQKFMGRCMTSEVMRSEYPNQKQRVAVCVQQSRAGANKFSISEMVQDELVYAKCNEDCGDEEEITESNLVIPEEDEWIDLGVESEEVEVASLWENIRKKKKREGKDYKPAKPGDKDRPQKDAWDRAKGDMSDYVFKSKEAAEKKAKEIGLKGAHEHKTGDGATVWMPGAKMKDFQDWYSKNKAEAAKYKNKTVKLNKPFRTPKGPKKFSVYVKNEKGNVVKVNFGDPNMEIKRDDPQRRKNFRSRHNCDNPGPKNKARYWSCRMWSSPSVTKITKSEAKDMSYSEEHEMSEQIEVDGYKTRHFDMCPSAQALYKKILSKDLSKRDKDLVSMSVRLQDGLFGLEKMAKNQGKASEQDLVKAMQFATRIMEVADNLGLKEEHGYIKMHVDVVRDLVKKESAEALQYGKPKKNDPRKTPAKPSERKKGSKKNKPKSASKPNKSIKFSEKTTSRLSKMVTEHNKKGKGSKATLGALKAVYRRGAGAFSTSHAPKMSRDGWAMARVRAFLYLLRNGRPSNPNYKQDNDLLPKSHKRSSK